MNLALRHPSGVSGKLPQREKQGAVQLDGSLSLSSGYAVAMIANDRLPQANETFSSLGIAVVKGKRGGELSGFSTNLWCIIRNLY